MSAISLLHTLHARGITLTPCGEQRLRVNAPNGTLTDADRRDIIASKVELLVLLADPVCPECGEPGKRLGTFRLGDGRGRYACPGCDLTFWAPATTEAVDESWERNYPSLSDQQFEAVVSHDLIVHAKYTVERSYATPDETPEAIWQRVGLLGRRTAGQEA